MKLLVTGVAGFVGGHLVAHVRRERPEAEIWGVTRPGNSRPADARVRVVDADLTEAEATEAVFDAVQPDAIVHLAGQASVHRSWEDPLGTYRANVLGLLNVLEALRRRDLRPRLLVVGSAEEYGLADAGAGALHEDLPLRPVSPYASSKAAQGCLALQYALSHGFPIVRTRTFQATGPGRADMFAESSFARQIADIEAGRQEPVLQVGNLEAVRDYLDVRDVVRAYWLLLEKGAPGEVYNVCSGRGVSIREVLSRLVAQARERVEVRVDPARLRPSDAARIVGDPRRLRGATGWTAAIPLETSLKDLLDDWRARAPAAAAARAR
jgi:GDP-4-dehydro-6-deoxy-D-mannose reductase